MQSVLGVYLVFGVVCLKIGMVFLVLGTVYWHIWRLVYMVYLAVTIVTPALVTLASDIRAPQSKLS